MSLSIHVELPAVCSAMFSCCCRREQPPTCGQRSIPNLNMLSSVSTASPLVFLVQTSPPVAPSGDLRWAHASHSCELDGAASPELMLQCSQALHRHGSKSTHSGLGLSRGVLPGSYCLYQYLQQATMQEDLEYTWLEQEKAVYRG